MYGMYGIHLCIQIGPYSYIALHDKIGWFSVRLEICQKIYTTKFSGERILHTENA